MSLKYHISSNGPRICKADVRECPYGVQGEPHFSSYEDAITAYNNKMVEAFGGIDTIKLNAKQKLHKTYYKTQEKAIKTNETIQNLRTRFINNIKLVKVTGNKRNIAKTLQKIRYAPMLARISFEEFAQREDKIRSIKETSNRLLLKGAIKLLDRQHIPSGVEQLKQIEKRDNLRKALEESLNVLSEMKGYKNRTIKNVRVGDILSDGRIISKVEERGDVFVIKTRESNGRFAKNITIPKNSSVVLETKRINNTRRIKPSAERKKMFYSNISEASETQKEKAKILYNNLREHKALMKVRLIKKQEELRRSTKNKVDAIGKKIGDSINYIESIEAESWERRGNIKKADDNAKHNVNNLKKMTIMNPFTGEVTTKVITN